MKKNIILILFFATSQVSFAQDAAKDSLLNLLKSAKEDSIKVDILVELSENSEEDNEILEYARQALALATKLNYHIGMARASNNVGYVYDNRGEVLLALEYYTESLNLRRQINDKKGIAVSLNNIGNIYTRQGNYKKAMEYSLTSLKMFEEAKDSFAIAIAQNNIAGLFMEDGNAILAINYHEKSLRIREKLKDYTGVVQSLNNMANIYGEQGKTDRATEYYLKSLKICESTGNKTGMAQAYNNIGYLFSDNKKSLDYYYKSLDLYKQVGSKEGIGTVYNNLGVAYSSINDNEKALEFYNKSLEIRKEIGAKPGISTLYINIGKLYEDKNNLPIAIEYYKKSLIIKEEIGAKQGIASAQNCIGNVYFKMDRYKEAENYCKQSLKISQELGFPLAIRNASFALSKIYGASGRYKEAYHMHVLFKQMADSTNFSESRKTTTALQMKFEFDKMEVKTRSEYTKREAVAKKEIEKQKLARNYTAAGFSLFLLSGGIFVFLINQRRKSQFNQTVSEVEMKALRSQMNPHFIFNSLNSIKRYMHEHDIGTADEYLTKFAKVMRMILENSQNQEVLLVDDLKALELYMQLESLRMKNKFTFEIITSDDIDPGNTLIPPLILQPFVENAIWHGFSNKEGPGKITILLQKDGNMLKCTVEDNGIGRVKSGILQNPSAEKKSLGMKITRSRIEIINKIKRTKAGIELIDLAEGMRVVVRLPLELDF